MGRLSYVVADGFGMILFNYRLEPRDVQGVP